MVNPEKATMTIRGRGLYTGKVTKRFKIVYPLSKAKIVLPKKMTYKGKALKPKPTVRCLGQKLRLNKDLYPVI